MSADCDRFERELAADILTDEHHAELQAHLASCEACRARQVGYERIALALRHAGAGASRRPDHVARVLASAPRRAVRPLWLGTATGAVLAAALFTWWCGRGSAPAGFSIEIVAAQTAAIRGDAHLGDRVRVRARAGQAIWIFRNDRELVLVCPRDCRRVDDAVIGEAVLDAIGRYQVVWLSSEHVPDAAQGLEPSVAAARAAGAAYELRTLDVE